MADPSEGTHIHRTPVRFVDGTVIMGVTFDAADPYEREVPPTFGLYLDPRWDPPWSHAHVDWPDFGVPRDVDALRSALTDLVARARVGDTVELGCLGGHGRTGTALACIAVMTGTPTDQAVTWIRANYCSRAVETDEQALLVTQF